MKQLPKQSRFNKSSVSFLCFGFPSMGIIIISLPSSVVDFVSCERLLKKAYYNNQCTCQGSPEGGKAGNPREIWHFWGCQSKKYQFSAFLPYSSSLFLPRGPFQLSNSPPWWSFTLSNSRGLLSSLGETNDSNIYNMIIHNSDLINLGILIHKPPARA